MSGNVFQLEDKILTNYTGYNQLSRFYNYCIQHQSKAHIHIDFSNAEWFDGNLCALLWAMVYYLNKMNGYTFSTDNIDIKNRFDVLFRNGFIKDGQPVSDAQKSTVPIQAFDINDKTGFCTYVENDLLQHRGIPGSLNDKLKEKICEDLLEVFCNTNFHANTTDPFFVGGQYFPKSKSLVFTMVDIGDGFLPRISLATQGNINTDLAAINWALAGNSSKYALDHCPGGLGLKNIYQYCVKSGGELQIISGDGYWSTSLENTIFRGGRQLPVQFKGTTINLFFKKN